MGKIILTGDRPTGRLHVGHYVGSLRRRVELQNSGEYSDIYIMIADSQALTDNADNPEKVRQNILEVALDYLSAGLDPEKSTIFIQSMVPELYEMTAYFMDIVTVSRLQRNPTVKSEIQMRNFEASIPVGFFTYPISQAADITAFKANVVPAGEDQMPMVEQTREIVHKFNTVYNTDTLVMPDILLPSNDACRRLPGTDGKDEVQTGMGRTGYLFAHQMYGVEPDIFTSAKALGGGIPIGAVCAGKKVASAFEPGDHGTTFGGNPFATAAGLAVFDIFEKEHLVENAGKMGKYFKEKLTELQNKYSDKITDVRNAGLLIGIQLEDSIAKTVFNKLFENKMLTSLCGGNTIRIAPPLIIKETDIDLFINTLSSILEEL